MANTSRINGFRPVKHLNGSPYNGQANLYYVYSASANLGVGDVVKFEDRSTNATGITVPTVDLAAAGDAIVGVIVGMVNAKLDPFGGLTTGSINIDTPQYLASGSSGYVLVSDSDDVLFEVEASNGTPTNRNIGLNINHANGTLSTTTGSSGATIDFGTEAATATLTFKIMGLVNRPDNEIGASARMLVKINNSQLGSSTGTAGVGTAG